MNIQAFAKATNITAYTIRYYEKIGLVKNIERNSSGHRCFTEKDVVWFEFIKHLKDTNMPLANIKKYADLRDICDTTSDLRMAMLEKHAQVLAKKIAEEQGHLNKLNDKINYYSEMLKRK